MSSLYYFILFFLPVCLFGQIEDSSVEKRPLIQVELQITLYPNPTVDHFNITTNRPLAGSFTLSNMIGKQLTSGTLKENDATEVMMNTYAKGIYLLSVFDEQGKRLTTRKIFRE